MRNAIGWAIVSILGVLGHPSLHAQSASSTALKTPPVAPVKPVIDDYHGTKVSDPYRYMENLDDPAVQSWFKAQNDYTRSVLARIPGRARLLERLEVLDNSVPRVGARRLPGDIYDVWKRLPGDEVSKLYRRAGMTGPDTLLVDPEKVKLAPSRQNKGKNTLSGGATSGDSRYEAVLVVPGGSELDGELHVFESATGRETGDIIAGVGAEGLQPCWLPDNRSFVYGRLQDLPPGAPAAEVRQKFRSYLHVVGTEPAKDVQVFGYGVVPSIDVDPSLIASVEIQPDSRYALGVLNGSVTQNSAYYIAPVSAIGKSNREWRKVADLADGVTSIAIHDDDLYVLTYNGAPRFKVLRTDARKPDLSSAEIVVPSTQAVITGIHPAKDGLYVQLLDGGIGRLTRVPYGSKAKPQPISLPFDGSISAETDPRLDGALIFGSSWTKAYKIYSYDPATEQVIDTRMQPQGPYDNPDNIESVEVKAAAADGTLVPLSIVYRKGIKMDGSNPVLLDGYGGYGVTMDPSFEPIWLAWFDMGGIRAVCHARGGGEYGEEWHLAGKGAMKPSTWRDFIACGRYLVDHKYTSPAHLAGKGTSAGGILIGRAITERPDLFAAAVDNVGVSDTLRFEITQNGETNIPELGTVKTEEGFKSLYAMSAYAHIEHGTRYPAVLFTTGMNDPRVDPWQMAKMAARMQAATTSGKPVLLRVEFAGGHGSMGGTHKQFHNAVADGWSFLLWQLGVPEFQPAKDAR
jgi:prolyl oligopeptidase